MTIRKCLMSAVLAALACGSAALASDQSVGASQAPQNDAAFSQADLTLAPSYLQTSGPTSLTPVDYLLDPTSFGKWMENNKLSITGFVEGGYFYDTNNPRQAGNPTAPNATGDSPTLIGFPGNYSNRGLLDQADLQLSKTIDHSKQWDFGFMIEGGYGIDDAQIHSNGILDNRTAGGNFNNHATTVSNDPDNQFDLVQANVSFLVPLGSGLTITAGKFVTLLGYEYINPTENPFYTHSYSFSFGIPLTNTGVLGSYTFGKLVNGNDLTVTAGITRGWNESTLDNNGSPDFIGQVTTSFTDKFGFTFNMTEGPEADRDVSDYWTVLEAIPTYQISDQLKVAVDIVYGDFPHGSQTDTIAPAPAFDGHAAQWYAVTPYAAYKVNNYVTFNARGEWYRDEGGYTITPANAPISANYYEVTVGAQIHPFPTNDILQWLQFRPEVRYDLSNRPVYNTAHTGAATGAGDYNEFTVAMDAIMQF